MDSDMTNPTACREAFEDHARTIGWGGFLLRDREYYSSDTVTQLWLTWQAAWNTRPTSAEVDRDAAMVERVARQLCMMDKLDPDQLDEYEDNGVEMSVPFWDQYKGDAQKLIDAALAERGEVGNG